MIEHNLFEMENYRELIDEVGVDKFRERFEELQKTAMEFIEMAGFSGALSLLVLVPVFGWIAVGILMIVSDFRIAKCFGKDSGFGVGLWLLNPIFMAILAFDSSTYTCLLYTSPSPRD